MVKQIALARWLERKGLEAMNSGYFSRAPRAVRLSNSARGG